MALNLVTLVLQMVVVLALCRLVGSLFLKIGQPRVNGEMFAGILLGPSLLGWVAPHVSSYVFPAASLEFLNALGQVGVVLFMFLAGLGIDPAELKSQARAAAVTTVVSILGPFLLAFPLAMYLYPRVSSSDVTFTNFALFLGAATSITAFPMLARMLIERKILSTRLGTVAMACAGASGVATWLILAYIVVLLRASHNTKTLWISFGGIAAFSLVMFLVIRPALRSFEKFFSERAGLSDGRLAGLLLLVLAASVCTGYLGIHPLFGAFMVGMVMPKDQRLNRYILDRLETLTVSLLLPLYFAFSGLRTNVGLVKGSEMWMYCGVIILAAILGKAVFSMLAAWATGLSLREAAGLGALLNTRGLIALVVLNIGLDLKVISQAMFAMLVVMALVNTVLTIPLLNLFCPRPSDAESKDREGLGAALKLSSSDSTA